VSAQNGSILPPALVLHQLIKGVACMSLKEELNQEKWTNPFYPDNKLWL